MIQLDSYSEQFEKEYWEAVGKKVNRGVQEKVIDSCKKFLPADFFIGEKEEFKSLIIAPFEKLKAAETYITNNTLPIMKKESFYKVTNKRSHMRKIYKTIHDSYTPLTNSIKKNLSLRVRIVKNAGLTVCPYCNRDYINCRAGNVSGAQLDHFYSKSDFPLFAICLYNLVPVCGNCNRIKSAQSLQFASPFDSRINWDNDLTFSFSNRTLKDVEIVINAQGNLANNMKAMRIKNAYQIHSTEVLELIEREQMYSSTQKQEFIKVLGQNNLTDYEIRKIIFGPEITKESMRTKPLGKLMYDLHKELKIYT